MLTVIAGIIQLGNTFLIGKRRLDDDEGGRWEFPGGTLEPNETHQECLQRELKEELGLDCEIGKLVASGKDGEIMLYFYKIVSFSGTPRANVHEKIVWVKKSELPNYTFPDVDKKILKSLIFD